MDAVIASETDLNAIIKEVARENLYHCVINYYFFNLFLTIQLNAKKFYYLLFFSCSLIVLGVSWVRADVFRV